MKDTIVSIDGRTIDDLVALVAEMHPDAETDLVRLAYDYAKEAHGDQRRKAGELYITHPLSTAFTLTEMGLDEATIAAGLLHDVPEDTERTLDDVQEEFGEEIAFLVEGITKLGLLKYRGVERYIENLRRMFVAMAKDVRVILIKFADRIHNLSTLDALPPEKQHRIALESLEIYAPIANRLGMGEVRGMIEDLAFPFVYPKAHTWMKNEVHPQLEWKKEMLVQFQGFIETTLKEHGVDYETIDGRSKHLYSLFKKMERYDHDVSQIYDVVALRIIVEDVSSCYETLGVIHEVCKPLKGRIKDYIAQPKPNGYQSLHTTVFAPSKFAKDNVRGEIIEIQIRTQQMHAEAEYGIAAHWKYKETNEAISSRQKEKLSWVRQVADLQSEADDDTQLLETLKIDVFQNYIFVFTPQGDVIELPENATPVDFAYKIHTDMGNKCSGAKINDQYVSLDTTLKSGDVVEVVTNPHRKGPSADWLNFVKTNGARHHIRWYVNQKARSIADKITD
jgi:GTP pyrophosphokinase